MTELKLGWSKFRIWHEGKYCETVFRDRAKVPAGPEDTDNYRLYAKTLGYGDNTWAMCWEGQLLHTWLAWKSGKPCSPALWAVAHGTDSGTIYEEEAAVMAFQNYYHTGFYSELDLSYFGPKALIDSWLAEATTLLTPIMLEEDKWAVK